MKYRQLVTPNLDPVIYQGGKVLAGWLGYCLAYVQSAYNAPWAGSTAWDGWSRVKKKHQDYSLPSGVYVPIWFDGWWNGGRYGHVAIYKDGKVWSSPWTGNKPYADVLGSIAEVERIYGMKYVGWSEDIGGVDVIKKEDDGLMIIQNAENWYGRCNKTHLQIRGRELSRDVFKDFVGKDFLKFVEVCSDDPEADRVQNWQNVGKLAVKDNWQKQIYDLLDALKKSNAALDAARKSEVVKGELEKQLKEAQAKADEAIKKANAVEAENSKLKAEKASDIEAGNSWIRRIVLAIKGAFSK